MTPTALLTTAAHWAWAKRWRRNLIRGILLWHLLGLTIIVFAGRALADPTNPSTDTPPPGGVGRIFGWMGLTDSHGIPASSYSLSIDHGNATPTGWWHFAWGWIITWEYEIYRAIMMLAIWFIRWALEFTWLKPLLTPAQKIATAFESITGQLSLTPFMFTLAGFAVAVWLFRGRFATAVYEALVACLIGAAGIILLANPISTVAGPRGMIPQARDTGLQIAARSPNH